VNEALAEPAFQARLVDLGGVSLPGPPAQFGRLVVADSEKLGKVIQAANITLE